MPDAESALMLRCHISLSPMLPLSDIFAATPDEAIAAAIYAATPPLIRCRRLLTPLLIFAALFAELSVY